MFTYEMDAVCTILHWCDVLPCRCAGELHMHTPPLGDGKSESSVEGNSGDTARCKHPAKLVRLHTHKEQLRRKHGEKKGLF